jgi:hypothetical protein
MVDLRVGGAENKARKSQLKLKRKLQKFDTNQWYALMDSYFRATQLERNDRPASCERRLHFGRESHRQPLGGDRSGRIRRNAVAVSRCGSARAREVIEENAHAARGGGLRHVVLLCV